MFYISQLFLSFCLNMIYLVTQVIYLILESMSLTKSEIYTLLGLLTKLLTFGQEALWAS